MAKIQLIQTLIKSFVAGCLIISILIYIPTPIKAVGSTDLNLSSGTPVVKIQNTTRTYFYDNSSYRFTEQYSGTITKSQVYDLSIAWKEYAELGIEPTGIYGGGYTSNNISIKAYDKNNKLLSQNSVSKGDFILDFSGAYKLLVTGPAASISFVFMPLEPYIVDSDADFNLGEIGWHMDSNEVQRAYLIIAMPYTAADASFAPGMTGECYIGENQYWLNNALTRPESGLIKGEFIDQDDLLKELGINKDDIQGDTGDYRLRVGSYRIVFSKDDKNLIIIVEIAPRGEVYKRL